MSATPTPELPVKECGTPDTKWGARVEAKFVLFTARFPVPLIAPQEASAFAAEMHAAMLPVVERLFERRWKQMFAGTCDAEGRPYPDDYQDLWNKSNLPIRQSPNRRGVMKAPDRIWVETVLTFSTAYKAEDRPIDPDLTEYLRATPELLALIEAAKAVSKAANVEYGPRPFNELMDAALAFAKEESGG